MPNIRSVVKTLTAADKYSLLNRDNFNAINSDTTIYETKKNVSEFFPAFLEFMLSFEGFEKKMTLIAYVFRKLQTAKCVVRLITKKSRFRRPFNKQHGKRSQTLLKSEGQHLYRNY